MSNNLLEATAKRPRLRSERSVRQMKATKKKWMMGCGGCLVALVAMFLTPLGIIPYGLYHGLMQRHRLEKAIEKNLPEIARACISLRQFLPTNEWFMSVNRDDPRMPEAIKRTKCRNVCIRQDMVEIEMHGGFDHFGIRVRRDEEQTNEWQVLRYREGGDKLLITITNEVRASNQPPEGTR